MEGACRRPPVSRKCGWKVHEGARPLGNTSSIEEFWLAVRVRACLPNSGKETCVEMVNVVGIHVRLHEDVAGWKFG